MSKIIFSRGFLDVDQGIIAVDRDLAGDRGKSTVNIDTVEGNRIIDGGEDVSAIGVQVDDCRGRVVVGLIEMADEIGCTAPRGIGDRFVFFCVITCRKPEGENDEKYYHKPKSFTVDHYIFSLPLIEAACFKSSASIR